MLRGNYFAAGRRAKSCNQHVCLSIRISKKHHTFKLYKMFCTCSLWLWLSPLLTTVQCLMHFQFCGWHSFHIMWHRAYASWQEATQRWEKLQHSAPLFCALPPTDWHPSAVSIAIHNGVLLWRWTMHCARGGKVCYPQQSCFTMVSIMMATQEVSFA